MVSVIIPTYNCERYICRAIESILKQTIKDIEIIVVDDGSNDGTRKALRPYAGDVTYLYQENRGPSAARNLGIENSRGQYLQFLDADDWLLPEKLKIQVALLGEREDVDVVACGVQFVDEQGRSLQGQIQFRNAAVAFEDLLFGNPFATECLLVRRRCFDLAGLFDEGMRCAEDWDMWVRIAGENCRFWTLPGKLSCHTVREGGLHESLDEMCRGRLCVLEKVFSHSARGQMFGHLKRRAYYEAHMKCAWTYYCSGEIMAGRSHVIAAFKAWPEGLARYEAFYGFPGLFQGLGSGGGTKLESVQKGENEMFEVLQALYSSDGISQQIKERCSGAYCNAHFGAGFRCLLVGEIRRSLLHLRECVRIDLSSLLRFTGHFGAAAVRNRINS